MATIFIMLDHEQLVARIRGRGQDDDAEIARRMATAEAELLEAPKFEFVIHSGSREEDFAALLKILATARARAA
jgi:guanylate kinase